MGFITHLVVAGFVLRSTVSWFMCLFMDTPLSLEDGLLFWDNLLV